VLSPKSREDGRVRKGRLLIGAACVLLLAFAVGMRWVVVARRRAMHVDPPPPFGPTHAAVIARELGPPYARILVDDADVWFMRDAPNDMSSLRAVPKRGGPEREVASIRRAGELVALDASYVYFGGSRTYGETVRRVAKTGRATEVVPGHCSAPVLVDGAALYCANVTTVDGFASDGLERVDLSSGAVRWRQTLGGEGDRISAIARGTDRLYVGTTWCGGDQCRSRLLEIRPEDGRMREVDSGANVGVVVADASGAYSLVRGYCGGNAMPITRHPPSFFASAIPLARHYPSDLALTPYHLVWCSVSKEDVFMVAKSGGEVLPIGGGQGCADVVTDATAAYFVDKWGALVRVDGIN
jgi:hypothetical protein